MQERNIAVCIILSIVTCGIYGLYWLYCIVEETNKMTGNEDATSGGTVILLSIVTCNIYLIYWMYVVGNRIDDLCVREGNSTGNRGILYLVLDLFGLGIVNYALLQNEINQRAHSNY